MNANKKSYNILHNIKYYFYILYKNCNFCSDKDFQ